MTKRQGTRAKCRHYKTYSLTPMTITGVHVSGKITERDLETTISLSLFHEELASWGEHTIKSFRMCDRTDDIKAYIRNELKSFNEAVMKSLRAGAA